MNLFNEFAEILDEYGYDFLVVKRDSEVKCSCFDEKTLSADRECPICYGLGTTVKVEKHVCRELDITTGDYAAKKNQVQNYGEVGLIGRKFFFQPQAKLAEGDLIVEVNWSPTGKPIWNKGHIFEVANVDPQRFEKGELIFYAVLVKDTNVEKDI